jgi:hypothetical protein
MDSRRQVRAPGAAGAAVVALRRAPAPPQDNQPPANTIAARARADQVINSVPRLHARRID